MTGVPFVNMRAQFAEERERLLPVVEEILSGGMWVGGDAVERFEAAMCAYTGARHCVALNSGTDALALGLKVLGVGPGDEVITPPNSFVASTAAIIQAGATPVFADVLPDQNIDPARVEAAITPKTRAIMPVHLTGRIADMDAIMAIADHYGLKVIEDAAQSIGSQLDGRQSGTIGHMGCFSAHPLKNLNAAGDAGYVLTDDDDMATRLRRLRNHGMVDRDTVGEWGVVSRMDSLQAAILVSRLEDLDDVIAKRHANAELYRQRLSTEVAFSPPCRNTEFNTFHTFVVQLDRRDELQAHLADLGIGTAIHYPVPIHLQPAAADLGHAIGDFPVAEEQAGRILSLPVHQFLAEVDIETVCDAINGFFA